MLHHPVFWQWTLYLLGQAANASLRSAATVSSKLNGINSYGRYLSEHWRFLFGRFFVASMLFLVWQSDPQLFLSILERFSGVRIQLPELNPVLSAAISGLYGFAADSLLDKAAVFIPALRREVPPNGGK